MLGCDTCYTPCARRNSMKLNFGSYKSQKISPAARKKNPCSLRSPGSLFSGSDTSVSHIFAERHRGRPRLRRAGPGRGMGAAATLRRVSEVQHLGEVLQRNVAQRQLLQLLHLRLALQLLQLRLNMTRCLLRRGARGRCSEVLTHRATGHGRAREGRGAGPATWHALSEREYEVRDGAVAAI